MIADGRFALVKTTLLDFPGRVAASVFLPGCHLRCPYCHNPDFVDPSRFNRLESLEWGLEEFRAFLNRRHTVLGGVAFSGGEALLHPLLRELIGLVRGYGLAVKLDTAGLLPDALAEILSSGDVEYVAMDLKTSPGRYGELGWEIGKETRVEELWDRSLTTLERSNIEFEVRTTIVPTLVEYADLMELRPWAEQAPLWAWQPYGPGETLNPDWGDLKRPDEDQLRDWTSEFGLKVRIEIR